MTSEGGLVEVAFGGNNFVETLVDGVVSVKRVPSSSRGESFLCKQASSHSSLYR